MARRPRRQPPPRSSSPHQGETIESQGSESGPESQVTESSSNSFSADGAPAGSRYSEQQSTVPDKYLMRTYESRCLQSDLTILSSAPTWDRFPVDESGADATIELPSALSVIAREAVSSTHFLVRPFFPSIDFGRVPHSDEGCNGPTQFYNSAAQLVAYFSLNSPDHVSKKPGFLLSRSNRLPYDKNSPDVIFAWITEKGMWEGGDHNVDFTRSIMQYMLQSHVDVQKDVRFTIRFVLRIANRFVFLVAIVHVISVCEQVATQSLPSVKVEYEVIYFVLKEPDNIGDSPPLEKMAERQTFCLNLSS